MTLNSPSTFGGFSQEYFAIQRWPNGVRNGETFCTSKSVEAFALALRVATLSLPVS